MSTFAGSSKKSAEGPKVKVYGSDVLGFQEFGSVDCRV